MGTSLYETGSGEQRGEGKMASQSSPRFEKKSEKKRSNKKLFFLDKKSGQKFRDWKKD